MYKADSEIAGKRIRAETKGGPRLVRSGRIASANAFKEILRLVISNREVETGILHIRTKSIQGDVVIGGGTKILGASTNSGKSGWSAARELLSSTEGLFQFHDFTGTNIGSLNQSMDIRLLAVIDALPQLPENFADLNVRTSMNKIRSMNTKSLAEDRNAEQAVLLHVKKEVQAFEERTMRFRAIILWSFFVLLSLATIVAKTLLS